MSLRSRIVLIVATVFAAVSAASGWLMLTRAEQSLQTAFDRATRTRAGWLLSLVDTDPVVLPLPNGDERMQVLTETYGHRRELFRSPGFPKSLIPDGAPFSRFPQPPAPRSNQEHRRRYVHQSYRAVTVDAPPDPSTDERLWLTLAVPDTSLRQDINQLQWVFGTGWLLSLVLAFVAAYGAAGWLLRPIRTLVEQADQIGRATRIDPLALPESRDELYNLAVALNQMLDRIRENIDTQRHFFGAAAHELRTPLAVMKTGLEVTLGSGRAGPELTMFLQSQLDDVRRLARLLDEFLTLSHPDDAPRQLSLNVINPADLLQRCLSQLADTAADYEVTLHLAPLPATDTNLLTDALKLEHILMNLIENAIKYAVSGSVVTVQLSYSDGCRIRVQNQTTREGSPTLNLRQPYFRADPLGDGHGLGLWISHRLALLLGGQLLLDWQAFTFTSEVQLPASALTELT